jgi:hypothetical protein
MARQQTTAPPADPGLPWRLADANSWAEADRASVRLELTTDSGGQGIVASATAAHDRFEEQFRLEARGLAEHATARECRAQLLGAEARAVELRERLGVLEQGDLDLSDGDLPRAAAEEGGVRQMLAVVERRLPALRDRAEAARRALSAAAAALHGRMRVKRIASAQQEREQLAGLLACAGPQLGRLVELSVLSASLSNPFDAPMAEQFAAAECPPVPPSGPPPVATTRDPFAPPGGWQGVAGPELHGRPANLAPPAPRPKVLTVPAEAEAAGVPAVAVAAAAVPPSPPAEVSHHGD